MIFFLYRCLWTRFIHAFCSCQFPCAVLPSIRRLRFYPSPLLEIIFENDYLANARNVEHWTRNRKLNEGVSEKCLGSNERRLNEEAATKTHTHTHIKCYANPNNVMIIILADYVIAKIHSIMQLCVPAHAFRDHPGP